MAWRFGAVLLWLPRVDVGVSDLIELIWNATSRCMVLISSRSASSAWKYTPMLDII